MPMDIDPDTSWIAVAVGGDHACGIHAGGAVDCWGDNSYDQLATTTTDGFLSTPTPLGASADALVLGLRQTCLLAGGVLQCAGSDGGGQLGTGGGSRREPVEVGHATKVAVGRQVTCAIDANTLTCWGDNSAGSVGDGTPFDRDVGVSIGALEAGRASPRATTSARSISRTSCGAGATTDTMPSAPAPAARCTRRSSPSRCMRSAQPPRPSTRARSTARARCGAGASTTRARSATSRR